MLACIYGKLQIPIGRPRASPPMIGSSLLYIKMFFVRGWGVGGSGLQVYWCLENDETSRCTSTCHLLQYLSVHRSGEVI